MRSYIFTEYERKLLREWLEQRVESSDALRKVLSRIRHAEQINEDVKLFLKARSKLLV